MRKNNQISSELDKCSLTLQNRRQCYYYLWRLFRPITAWRRRKNSYGHIALTAHVTLLSPMLLNGILLPFFTFYIQISLIKNTAFLRVFKIFFIIFLRFIWKLHIYKYFLKFDYFLFCENVSHVFRIRNLSLFFSYWMLSKTFLLLKL